MQIRLIHRQDIIKPRKIFNDHLARLQVTYIDTALHGRGLRAMVWLCAYVVANGTRTIYINFTREPLQLYQPPKHPMGSRRPTNIAHTDEEHSYFIPIFHTVNSLLLLKYIVGKVSYPHNKINNLQTTQGKYALLNPPAADFYLCLPKPVWCARAAGENAYFRQEKA